MPKLLIPAIALLLAAASVSEARQSTLTMTCDQARSLVAARGAVVLTTGRHTFNRFVRTPGYCMLAEYGEPGLAPTRDARQCVVGYVCRPRPHFFEDGFRDRFFR